jgi:hypothetical protein
MAERVDGCGSGSKSCWNSDFDQLFEIRMSTTIEGDNSVIYDMWTYIGGLNRLFRPLFRENVEWISVIRWPHQRLCSGELSSTNRRSTDPKTATGLKNRIPLSYFRTNNEPNSWICYGRRNTEIRLTHSSIVSYPQGPSVWHLKSWCIKADTTSKDWTKIDRCTDNSDVNGPIPIGRCKVDRSARCRLVHLRYCGKNHQNIDYFLMCEFEIFGSPRNDDDSWSLLMKIH